MTTDAEDVTNPEEEVTQNLQADDQEADNQSEQSSEDSDQEDQQADPADELEDIDLDGAQYKLPKAVAQAVMRHADYTQKTQDLAEIRAMHTQEREQFEQSAQAHAAFMGDLKRLHAIDDQIEQLQRVDFEALAAEDPDRAQRLMFRLQKFRGDREQVAQELNGKNMQRLQAQAAELATSQSHARAILAKPDPSVGWGKEGLTPQVKAKLDAVGTHLGFTPQELARVIDPRYVKTLHLAEIGLQTLKKMQAATAKPRVGTGAEPKPISTVGKGGKTPKPGLHDDLNDSEWLRRRNAQIKQRNG